MDTLWQDLRHGARMLVRNPGFTASAVLVLGLGIGANTAIFSVVQAVLLRPLPFKDPDRLVAVWDVEPGRPMSYPEYLDRKERHDILEELAAYFDTAFVVTGGRGLLPETVTGMRSSASLLRLLGLAPAAGRPFRPDEDSRASERVALISHRFWHRRLGGDPQAVGSVLTVDGEPHTVAGILPRDLRFQSDRDIWVPLRLDGNAVADDLHLGARRRQLLALVVGQGVRWTLAGAALGIGAALALGRLLSGVLFDVSPADPLTYAGVVVLLTAVASLASYLPARRAARLDPMSALRRE